VIHKTDTLTSGRPALASRKKHVIAQYDGAEAATRYAHSHHSSRPAARHFRSRIWLIQDILSAYSGGDLLDAGCGPGILVQTLMETRPHDFRIAVLDQSPAMIEYCMANVGNVDTVRPAIGQLEALPYTDASFNITLVTGALEYTELRKAIREISRVTRPGGIVVVTMLNPLSLYRLTEWFLYWPAVRTLGTIEKSLGISKVRKHDVSATGIRAFPAGLLCRLMRQASLQPVDRFYYDLVPVIPPFDRIPRIAHIAERIPIERTVTRGWRRWMATGYVLVAKR
jgi:ubiquinone/menaquinone biosynthesis C-methylase UbiE